MKKVLLLAVLALALPIAAFADSATFINVGGTLSGNRYTGISLTNSDLISISGLDGLGNLFGPDLGTLSFTTGAFTGNFETTGTFAPGGSFTITGSGLNGAPSGVIFTGEFTTGPNGADPTWTASNTIFADHSKRYTLSGVISGTLADGTQVNGMTWQMGFTTHAGYFAVNARAAEGLTVLDIPKVSAPEPGMLGMLGTGLFALIGVFRRKILV